MPQPNQPHGDWADQLADALDDCLFDLDGDESDPEYAFRKSQGDDDQITLDL